MSITINLEIGHEASLRKKSTQEGFTHDWEVYVRGVNGADIQCYVEKVVFYLHETFPKPKRVLKEPPYSVKTSGYAGFNLPIDVYLKNNQEPRKIRFTYDLTLQPEGPTIYNVQKEKYVFDSPPEDFKNKLLKGGAVVGSSGSIDSSETRSNIDEKNQMTSKPKLSGSEITKKPKFRPDENRDSFRNLFGTPITKFSKVSPEPAKPKDATKIPSSKPGTEKPKTKSIYKDKDKEKSKEKSSEPDKKIRDDKKSTDRKRERERSKEKSSKKEKDERSKSGSPKHSSSSKDSSQKDQRERKDERKSKKEKREHKENKYKDKDRERSESSSHKEHKNRGESKPNKDTPSKDIVIKEAPPSPPPPPPPPVQKPEKKEKTPKEKETTKDMKDEERRSEEKTRHKHKKRDKDRKDRKDEKVHKSQEKKSEKLKENGKDLSSSSSVSMKDSTDKSNLFGSPKTILSPMQQDTPKKEKQPLPTPMLIVDDSSNSSKNSCSRESSPEVHSSSPFALEPLPPPPPPPIQKKPEAAPATTTTQPDVKRSKDDKDRKREKKEKKKEKKSDKDHERKKKRKEMKAEAEGEVPPEKKFKEEVVVVNHQSDDEMKVSSSEDAAFAAAANVETEDYMGALRDLQRKIMELRDNSDLQKVVQLIAETGRYEVSAHTFDFDLCLLDRATVRQLQDFFS